MAKIKLWDEINTALSIGKHRMSQKIFVHNLFAKVSTGNSGLRGVWVNLVPGFPYLKGSREH